MAEEEVMAEVEAAQAVYGDDCQVIQAYPPHLLVHLKPRTADVSSQQFVEATIGIQANLQYPEEPPEVRVVDSKGLDEQRQKHLVASIRGKASELASCLMLVALCEEAVEKLSSMNHPDGDCPLCLYPLLDEDFCGSSLPFMKLMSCFHCFHCECIIRWWNWNHVQSEKEVSTSESSTPPRSMQDHQGMRKMMEETMGKCPVCRKVFLAKDIEHVLVLVGNGGDLDIDAIGIDRDLLHSDSEKIRRERFEAILKIQQEKSGLIEPKKNEVLLPGMFLPQTISQPSTESDGIFGEAQNKDLPQPVSQPSSASDGISREARNKGPAVKSGNNHESSFNGPGPRKHNNSNMRKHRTQNSSKQVRHWIRKDISEN